MRGPSGAGGLPRVPTSLYLYNIIQLRTKPHRFEAQDSDKPHRTNDRSDDDCGSAGAQKHAPRAPTQALRAPQRLPATWLRPPGLAMAWPWHGSGGWAGLKACQPACLPAWRPAAWPFKAPSGPASFASFGLSLPLLQGLRTTSWLLPPATKPCAGNSGSSAVKAGETTHGKVCVR